MSPNNPVRVCFDYTAMHCIWVGLEISNCNGQEDPRRQARCKTPQESGQGVDQPISGMAGMAVTPKNSDRRPRRLKNRLLWLKHPKWMPMTKSTWKICSRPVPRRREDDKEYEEHEVLCLLPMRRCFCIKNCNKSHRFCLCFWGTRFQRTSKAAGRGPYLNISDLVSPLHQSGEVALEKELAAIDKATEVIQVPFWHQGGLVHLWNWTVQDEISIFMRYWERYVYKPFQRH